MCRVILLSIILFTVKGYACDTIRLNYNCESKLFEISKASYQNLSKNNLDFNEFAKGLEFPAECQGNGISGSTFVKVTNGTPKIFRGVCNEFNQEILKQIGFANFKMDSVYMIIYISNCLTPKPKEFSDSLLQMKIETKLLYLQAIQTVINENKYFSSSSDSTIFIKENQQIDSVPSRLNGWRLIIINDENKAKIYKENSNSLTIISTDGPFFRNDIMCIRLLINTSSFHKGKEYFSVCLANYNFFYKYDCTVQKYLFKKLEKNGL